METIASQHNNDIDNMNLQANERLVTLDEVTMLEAIPVDNTSALIAHDALRNAVQLRNLHNAGMFPLSGTRKYSKEPNPTDEQIASAAREVAALTLDASSASKIKNLHSSMLDNDHFFQPPTVEIASLLVGAATETHDPQVRDMAKAALGSIDPDIAEPLTYTLDKELGTLTKSEEDAYQEALRLADLREDLKLGDAADRVERLQQYTPKELEELNRDDASLADMADLLSD